MLPQQDVKQATGWTRAFLCPQQILMSLKSVAPFLFLHFPVSVCVFVLWVGGVGTDAALAYLLQTAS